MTTDNEQETQDNQDQEEAPERTLENEDFVLKGAAGPIEGYHRTDLQTNAPAGGVVSGTGFSVNWQDGPLMMGGVRRDPNGAFVEDLIKVSINRIQFYQDSRFSCRENAIAITKLEEALHRLHDRTERRTEEGVEGTHEGS